MGYIENEAKRFKCHTCDARPGQRCRVLSTGQELISYVHVDRLIQENDAWKAENDENDAISKAKGLLATLISPANGHGERKLLRNRYGKVAPQPGGL